MYNMGETKTTYIKNKKFKQVEMIKILFIKSNDSVDLKIEMFFEPFISRVNQFN